MQKALDPDQDDRTINLGGGGATTAKRTKKEGRKNIPQSPSPREGPMLKIPHLGKGNVHPNGHGGRGNKFGMS